MLWVFDRVANLLLLLLLLLLCLKLGDFMAAVARKAAHDTQMLGIMIAQKAQHDMNALQEQKPHPAPDTA
jgi:outer membrane biosynthesis protein TonB